MLYCRAIQELVQNHSSTLEELELDGAELTDVATKALAHCQNLTSLSISFCELLTDASLYSIQVCSPISNMTDASFHNIQVCSCQSVQ